MSSAPHFPLGPQSGNVENQCWYCWRLMVAAQKVYREYIPARTNTQAVGQKSVNHR